MKGVSKEWCHFSLSRPGEKTACRLLQEMWCRHCSWISTSYLLGTTCWRGPQSPVSNIVTSLGTIYDRLSNQNIMVCAVMMSCCSMAMIGHLQLVWQPRWWKAFIVRVSFSFLTCLTLLLMTIMFLGWSRRLLAKYVFIWWNARGSGRVAANQLPLWHQTVHILCHIHVSVPEWCCICVSELWPFMYSCAAMLGFSLFFLLFFLVNVAWKS